MEIRRVLIIDIRNLVGALLDPRFTRNICTRFLEDWDSHGLFRHTHLLRGRLLLPLQLQNHLRKLLFSKTEWILLGRGLHRGHDGGVADGVGHGINVQENLLILPVKHLSRLKPCTLVHIHENRRFLHNFGAIVAVIGYGGEGYRLVLMAGGLLASLIWNLVDSRGGFIGCLLVILLWITFLLFILW